MRRHLGVERNPGRLDDVEMAHDSEEAEESDRQRARVSELKAAERVEPGQRHGGQDEAERGIRRHPSGRGRATGAGGLVEQQLVNAEIGVKDVLGEGGRAEQRDQAGQQVGEPARATAGRAGLHEPERRAGQHESQRRIRHHGREAGADALEYWNVEGPARQHQAAAEHEERRYRQWKRATTDGRGGECFGAHGLRSILWTPLPAW